MAVRRNNQIGKQGNIVLKRERHSFSDGARLIGVVVRLRLRIGKQLLEGRNIYPSSVRNLGGDMLITAFGRMTEIGIRPRGQACGRDQRKDGYNPFFMQLFHACSFLCFFVSL